MRDKGIFSAVFFLTILFGCITNSNNSTNLTVNNLEQELLKYGYQDLFLFGDRSAVYKIWENEKNHNTLSKIVSDKNSTPYGRFLAAETLRKYKVEIDEKYYPILALAYADALKNSSLDLENTNFISGNSWGFLYKQDDSGHLGSQFLKFGGHSIGPLEKLLENNANMVYEGSQEAMIGNSYEYRIKDFATFYLHKITNIPIEFHQDLAKRDQEIERFKVELDKYQNG